MERWSECEVTRVWWLGLVGRMMTHRLLVFFLSLLTRIYWMLGTPVQPRSHGLVHHFLSCWYCPGHFLYSGWQEPAFDHLLNASRRPSAPAEPSLPSVRGCDTRLVLPRPIRSAALCSFHLFSFAHASWQVYLFLKKTSSLFSSNLSHPPHCSSFTGDNLVFSFTLNKSELMKNPSTSCHQITKLLSTCNFIPSFLSLNSFSFPPLCYYLLAVSFHCLWGSQSWL